MKSLALIISLLIAATGTFAQTQAAPDADDALSKIVAAGFEGAQIKVED